MALENMSMFVKFAKHILIFSLLTLNSALVTAQGFSYAMRTLSAGERKQPIHLLIVDPKFYDFEIVKSTNERNGVEPLATLAKKNHAIAAINGGFFKLDHENKGLPAGALKIKQHWYGIAYRTRGAMAWSIGDQTPFFDRIATKTSIVINQKHYPLNGFNLPMKKNKYLLFSSAFSSPIKTTQDTHSLLIQQSKIKTFTQQAFIQLKPNELLYSMPQLKKHNLPLPKPGDSVDFSIKIKPQINKNQGLAWQNADYLINGGPLLIMNGKPIKDFSPERLNHNFLFEPHARTAIGVQKNKAWVFLVAPENPFEKQFGLTIPELVQAMEALHCEHAFNLDGGSSSSMYVQKKDLSLPFSEPIADAIIIVPKKTKPS